MFQRTLRYTVVFSAFIGLAHSNANAQEIAPPKQIATTAPTPKPSPAPTQAPSPAPTPQQTAKPQPTTGKIQTSVTVVCTAKPVPIFRPNPPQQTTIYNVDWDLSSILACFNDKGLGTAYLQYLLNEFYQNQIPPIVTGSGNVLVSCQVCYSSNPNGTQTPPNYPNFCTVVNNLDPIVDPSELFSPAELACAQAALDKLGKNNGPATTTK
ncbi:MAG: hypothetical protein U0136_14130 [Bdellovibrionota bacterium]